MFWVLWVSNYCGYCQVTRVNLTDCNNSHAFLSTLQPRITYIAVTRNTFDVDDWYVWFVTVLGVLLLLGILAYLLYRCFRYLSTKECNCTCDCCESKYVEDEDTL